MFISKSHTIWNRHNPYDEIGRGRYKDVIHHKDGNHDNNDISNLQKMTFKEHNSLHKKGNTNCLGRKHSEETREKMKINHANLKGEDSPIFGRKHSEEARRKMSLAQKGKSPSEEHKKKISDSLMGKLVGFKNGMFGRDQSGCKNPMWGKKQSDETKRKISETKKRRNKERRKLIPVEVDQ